MFSFIIFMTLYGKIDAHMNIKIYEHNSKNYVCTLIIKKR